MGWLRFTQAGIFTRSFAGALGSAILLLAAQVPASAAAPPYQVAQLRAAYNVPADVRGAGETIVIIDAFQAPIDRLGVSATQKDLDMFSLAEGLPPATLDIRTPDGTTPFDGSALQKFWFAEESADAEWAHAIAPDARLVMVEAKTADDADLISAINFAIDNNLGDVISMSFSEAEICPTADVPGALHPAFERAVAQGITLVAASGDMGGTQFDCTGHPLRAVATPASDPLVTAVGGSHLMPDGSEEAWADARGASGGGFSAVYSRPAYQAPFQKNNAARGVPDVAWNASALNPTLVVVHGMPRPAFGTSVATVQWAGVVALADQAAGHRLGAINEALYHAAKGNDASERFHSLGHGSWDTATGLGTPNVSNLIAWIAKHF